MHSPTPLWKDRRNRSGLHLCETRWLPRYALGVPRYRAGVSVKKRRQAYSKNSGHIPFGAGLLEETEMEKEETAAAEITPAAQKFLREQIQAVWQLELVMFMKQNAVAMSAANIAAHLYSSPREIEVALSRFDKNGVLIADGGEPTVYFYRPETNELKEAIEDACAAYQNKRFAVINFIFSRNSAEGS